MYAPSTGRRPLRRRLLVGAGVVAAVVIAVVAVVVVQVARDVSWRAPEFPALADNPDPSVQGTVAYLDDATGCVDVVAAGGGTPKEVFCLPEEEVGKSQALGSP